MPIVAGRHRRPDTPAFEAHPLDQGRAFHPVAGLFEKESGEGIVRVHSVKRRYERLHMGHPYRMPVDVDNGIDGDLLNACFMECLLDHVDPFARGERILRGVRGLRAADTEDESTVGVLGPNAFDHGQVAAVERLEAPDEEAAHGAPPGLLRAHLVYVVDKLVDMGALSREVEPTMRAPCIVQRGRKTVVEGVARATDEPVVLGGDGGVEEASRQRWTMHRDARGRASHELVGRAGGVLSVPGGGSVRLVA